MAILATVAHPAYVSYVQRRRRTVSTSVVRVHTPVSIAEADARAFDRPGILKANAAHGWDLEPWIRDGVAWHPVRAIPSGGPPVTGAQLCAWLSAEGGRDAAADAALTAALGGTPVSRRCVVAPFADHATHERRGRTGFLDSDASRIDADDREASAAAVAAFARDEILVVEGTAFARLRPAFRRRQGGGLFEEVVAAREATRRNPVYALDRRDDAAALTGSPLAESPAIRDVRAILAGAAIEDCDLVAMANVLPEAVHAVIETFAWGHRTVAPDLREACMAAKPRLQELARLGERGMIGPSEAPAVLERLRDAGEMVRHASARLLSGSVHSGLVLALEYVDRVALPRLRERDMGADADALGSLAP
jgi:hypothetical protein